MIQYLHLIHDTRVLILPKSNTSQYSLHNIHNLMDLAFSTQAELLVLPIEHFDDSFFQLNTQIAGEFIQKFINYKIRLAFLGNIDKFLHQSKAFTDFVYESNLGASCWFVQNIDELKQKLSMYKA
ncbi:hypothetical protein B9T31_10520 [Acinetobacter sp. ANC 4558]|uniref:DUF4180 domain-containing protein n=1 Tax=Acinetobacter sp. ANC 4558 TaxID=1977876 RepID=UPI000A336214|nr:DUF4180 domain-containing protein [Acinetobacter sp. ANC 4558]OTG85592.1 hypothetical protein B9T31_10520 [Acinetobacter sp. ANC 4558]